VDDLRRRADHVATATAFSGVVRLDRGGDVLLDAAFGLAERAHGIAMTTTTAATGDAGLHTT
jgi:hypothetical protein